MILENTGVPCPTCFAPADKPCKFEPGALEIKHYKDKAVHTSRWTMAEDKRRQMTQMPWPLKDVEQARQTALEAMDFCQDAKAGWERAREEADKAYDVWQSAEKQAKEAADEARWQHTRYLESLVPTEELSAS